MSVCAIRCVADHGLEVADFCDAQREWWAQRLDIWHMEFPPTTLSDVYVRRLDAQAFEDCFLQWVQDLQEWPGPGDSHRWQERAPLGRGTRQQGPLHRVSAWATAHRRVRAQPAVDTKAHEITAIPALLQRLAVSGGIVTMDRVPLGGGASRASPAG